MHSYNIRRDLEVGVVSTQDLEYHRFTLHNSKFTGMSTYFIDDHPEGVAIRLPGRPVVF